MDYKYLIIVLILIVLDVISGILSAVYNHNFNSSGMRKGAFHKITEILSELLMYVFEYSLPLLGYNYNIPFIKVFTLYLIVMEMTSIFENIGKINSDLIKPLNKILKYFEKEDNDNDE